jgi:hypothetical protein
MSTLWHDLCHIFLSSRASFDSSKSRTLARFTPYKGDERCIVMHRGRPQGPGTVRASPPSHRPHPWVGSRVQPVKLPAAKLRRGLRTWNSLRIRKRYYNDRDPFRGDQVMAEKRGYSPDRRSGRDRRVKNEPGSLANGIERRSGKERRSGNERRAGWLKVGRWHSVFPWGRRHHNRQKSNVEEPWTTSRGGDARDIAGH